MRSKIIKVLRWLPFVVVGIEIVLLITGVLTVAQAAIIIVTLEISLGFMLVIEIAALRNGFRKARAAGATRTQALAAAVEYVLPKPVAAMILQEFRIFGALLTFGRRRATNGVSEIPYWRGLRVIVAVLAVLSVIGGIVAALLIPTGWVRWLVIGLAAYWLLAAVGYGLLMEKHPHLASRNEIRLRLGSTVDIGLPDPMINDVRLETHAGARTSYLVSDGTLALSVMGTTNVVVSMAVPVPVQDRSFNLARAEQTPELVRQVRFFADDPHRAIAALSSLAT